jgi:hypothetical protein
MLPREQTLPAGGISFLTDDTTSTCQLWPKTVTAEFQLRECALANATKYPVCPSGGYESLSQILSAPTYIGRRNGINLPGEFDGTGSDPMCQARGVEGSRVWHNFLILSGTPNQLIPPVINGVRNRPQWASNGTVAVQPHAATILKMQELRRRWWRLVPKVDSSRDAQYRWTCDRADSGLSH